MTIGEGSTPLTDGERAAAPPPWLGALAAACAEPPAAAETAPSGRRGLYWAIGVLCALIIVAAEIGILLLAGARSAAAVPDAPAGAVRADPCAARPSFGLDARAPAIAATTAGGATSAGA